jgi:hypothetical protein
LEGVPKGRQMRGTVRCVRAGRRQLHMHTRMKDIPIVMFFDKLEDTIRIFLSHHPIMYALIGGIGIVLFWKGVWEMAEIPALFGFPSFVIGSFILLATGLLVSFFIGDNIILSGYKHEKKLAEKTEVEVRTEKTKIDEVYAKLERIEKMLKTRTKQRE